MTAGDRGRDLGEAGRLVGGEGRCLEESSAYPATPDSKYGWEKLFSERLYITYGLQTRSFLHVDEWLEGTIRLMRPDVTHPVNVGSNEMATINQLVDIVAAIAGAAIPRDAVRRSGSSKPAHRHSGGVKTVRRPETQPS